MFDKWLNFPAHYYLHLTALSILIVGVPLSNVLMSIGSIWIIANWLIELKFNAKLKRLKKNKPLLLIIFIYILLIISLLWSNNLSYGLKDLMVKLPLLSIPLVLGTTQILTPKIYRFLLYLLLLSLTFTTIYNFINYNLNSKQTDIRSMSIFISHIRLGGVICLALFLVSFETIKKRMPFYLTVPILIWLLFYIYYSQTVSAYVLFIILFITSLLFLLNRKHLLIATLCLSVCIGGTLFFTFNYLSKQTVVPKTYNTNKLVLYTPNGYSYYHDTTVTTQENGNLIWLYVCVEECEIEWNKRSHINYKSTDKKGQPLYGTLFRYMTSKGLKKDSLDFQKLTNQDIINIENGQFNFIKNHGFRGKIIEMYQDYLIYKNNGDPNNHSFIQRIEHLKTGLQIVKNNWLLGVGVGDVKQAFNSQYLINNTKLSVYHRLRSHNQFITTWISIGIVGFFMLIYILFSPLFTKNKSYLVIIVSISLIFAFFTQDFIETQAGVTIFALFYGLINNYIYKWQD